MIYGYENYTNIVCYTLYNNITGENEYRETPVEQTTLKHYDYVLKTDFTNISKQLCVSDISTVPSNAKLCFNATSKFPRFKLEQTEYKRKIKPELADYIIINTDINVNPSQLYVYTNNVDTLYLCFDCAPANKEVTLLDSIVYSLTNAIKEYLDLHKANHKYLSDDQLNMLCDTCAPDLTLETLNQIMNLVFSDDKENIELGLKVYAATNVSKYPMTTRYLMSCVNLPAINKNVTIRNLKTQADIRYNLFGQMWYDHVSDWSVNCFHNKSDMPNATAEDREFALRIIHRFIKKYMRESEIHRIKWLNREYYNA